MGRVENLIVSANHVAAQETVRIFAAAALGRRDRDVEKAIEALEVNDPRPIDRKLATLLKLVPPGAGETRREHSTQSDVCTHFVADLRDILAGDLDPNQLRRIPKELQATKKERERAAERATPLPPNVELRLDLLRRAYLRMEKRETKLEAEACRDIKRDERLREAKMAVLLGAYEVFSAMDFEGGKLPDELAGMYAICLQMSANQNPSEAYVAGELPGFLWIVRCTLQAKGLV